MNADLGGTAVTASPLDLADLVCADPDLVRREFDDLIAASWDAPPPDRPRLPRRCPPRRPAPIGRRRHRRTAWASRPAEGAGAAAAPARERGPPDIPI